MSGTHTTKAVGKHEVTKAKENQKVYKKKRLELDFVGTVGNLQRLLRHCSSGESVLTDAQERVAYPVSSSVCTGGRQSCLASGRELLV